jgi:hypothetical protein
MKIVQVSLMLIFQDAKCQFAMPMTLVNLPKGTHSCSKLPNPLNDVVLNESVLFPRSRLSTDPHCVLFDPVV